MIGIIIRKNVYIYGWPLRSRMNYPFNSSGNVVKTGLENVLNFPGERCGQVY